MPHSRWFQVLSYLGLEFWLPLPLLGLSFWLFSGAITEHVLSRSDKIKHKISVETEQETLFTESKIRSIQLNINESQGISKVKVKLAYSALKEVELEFSKTQLAQVEVAIAKELGLTIQQVKKLGSVDTK